MMNTLSAYETLPKGTESHGFRKQLKAGIWIDGEFDWYSEEEVAVNTGGQMRSLIQSFSKQHISFVRCTIKNTSAFLKSPKMVFHYENMRDPQNVAFYCPGEKAILHIGKKSISLLGGVVKGKGISQYCIQGKGSLYQYGCFKSLKEGILSYSPLAKGEVSSIFSLEPEIQPDECIEAVAWVIHTNTKEEALFMHEKLLSALPH
ncbi:hypothetical protein [Peribacillus loiseleuriae]|nr:hypothetical protein [Peribacillus loiseleuriae]